MTCLLEASAEELPLHCTDCNDSVPLRRYPVNFCSKGSSFSFSEDPIGPIGVERPSLKGSLPGYCVSVLGCWVSVFLFKVDGKPNVSEYDYGPLLQDEGGTCDDRRAVPSRRRQTLHNEL